MCDGGAAARQSAPVVAFVAVLGPWLNDEGFLLISCDALASR